jgi:hypothetical protein
MCIAGAGRPWLLNMCDIVDCLLATIALTKNISYRKYERVCVERADQRAAFMRALHDRYG